jgi:hypothetical protein
MSKARAQALYRGQLLQQTICINLSCTCCIHIRCSICEHRLQVLEKRWTQCCECEGLFRQFEGLAVHEPEVRVEGGERAIR